MAYTLSVRILLLIVGCKVNLFAIITHTLIVFIISCTLLTPSSHSLNLLAMVSILSFSKTFGATQLTVTSLLI